MSIVRTDTAMEASNRRLSVILKDKRLGSLKRFCSPGGEHNPIPLEPGHFILIREAVELRDGDVKRYGGKGVLRAVANGRGGP